jgi:hypothetical protein
MTFLERVVAAHGGLDRWHDTAAVELDLSAGGVAFASKGQRRALRSVRATVSTQGQTVELQTPDWRRSFSTTIPHPSGLRWTADDTAAFTAAALWTYVNLPFVLPTFAVDVDEQRQRVRIAIPDTIRTHSPRQTIHVDPSGLIARHDYTALAFGRLATATQVLSEYIDVDGLVLATRRRVHPRVWPQRHRPLLVWIDIHAARRIPKNGSWMQSLHP